MKKYENYVSNLKVLSSARNEDLSNEFIISGIIDKFFIQFELGWKLLKQLLQYEGNAQAATGSPRSIIKAAYSIYDFLDEEVWLTMLDARNDMTHIYDGQAAENIVSNILEEYIPAFEALKNDLERLYGEQLQEEL